MPVKNIIRLMLALAVFLSSAGLQPALAGSNRPFQQDDPPPALPDFPVEVYLPFTVLKPAYTVSGSVEDASGNPLAGVTVTGQNGETALTNSLGQYTLSVSGGNASVAPAKQGFMFSPSMLELNLNGNLAGQDFTALQDCAQAISNGGFETTSWWTLVSAGYAPAYTNAVAHEGMR
jgi:hypothetical protein